MNKHIERLNRLIEKRNAQDYFAAHMARWGTHQDGLYKQYNEHHQSM